MNKVANLKKKNVLTLIHLPLIPALGKSWSSQLTHVFSLLVRALTKFLQCVAWVGP